MQNLNVTFENDDGQTLAGLMAMPSGTPGAYPSNASTRKR